MRFAELKPDLPASIFPRRLQSQEEPSRSIFLQPRTEAVRVNDARRRCEEVFRTEGTQTDDFADDELDDQDLIAAGRFSSSLRKSPHVC